jgi:hypothetical protein
LVFFSSGRRSALRHNFERSFLFFVLQLEFLRFLGIMPPSDSSVPSKSQIRNEKRKRARQLQSVRSAIQKIFTNRLQKELVDLTIAHKKSEAELTCVKNANDRLQFIAQSATLDSYIHKRSAENHAVKLVEKDRIIASLSAAAAAAAAVESPP